jgi:hypothetical protein
MSDTKPEMPFHVQNELYAWATELRRPSLMFQPTLSKDGDQWCVLLGANLQDGCSGFGDTPDAAFRDFDSHFIYGERAKEGKHE